MSVEPHDPLPEPVASALSERADLGTLELPVLPDVAGRLLYLCGDEDCDARELAEVVERDQALTGHVLRVANSAAYAPEQEIVSVRQAVARLGTATLSEIALGVALQGKVFQVRGFEGRVRELWKHSAAAAAWAKEIARAMRHNVEGAFLCGLLHDVGKPVCLQALSEICAEVGEELDAELAEAAMDRFHATLGAVLVRGWGLSPWVQAAAEHHHGWADAESHRREAGLAHLADLLAHWSLGTHDTTPEELACLPVLAELELYDDDVRRLLESRDAAVALAEAFA